MAAPSHHRLVRGRGREEAPPDLRLTRRGIGDGVQVPLDRLSACAEGGGKPPRSVILFVHPPLRRPKVDLTSQRRQGTA